MRINPASIAFSGKEKIVNQAPATVSSAVSVPVFAGGALNASQWQARSGVRFGASQSSEATRENVRFAEGAGDRFYTGVMSRLPSTMATAIDETMKRAEAKAGEVGSREITPIHFLYGMLELVQDNFDALAIGGKLPADASGELKAAREVYDALFPSEYSRYLPKEDISGILSRKLMETNLSCLRLANAPSDKMQSTLRQYSYALYSQGKTPGEVDAIVNQFMAPAKSASDDEVRAMMEFAPEGIREMLAESLGVNSQPAAAPEVADLPADGPVQRSRELDSVLMELVSDQELTASNFELSESLQVPDEERTKDGRNTVVMTPGDSALNVDRDDEVKPAERTIASLIEKFSNEAFAVTMGSSFIETQKQLGALREELAESKDIQTLSRHNFGEVPEDPKEFAKYLETISPLLGQKPGENDAGGLYFQAREIARNTNADSVKPVHLVLAMVLLAEKLQDVKPEFAMGSVVDVPETFKLRNDEKIQAMQTADFPARFARIALDVLIPPDARENLTGDQVKVILRDARKALIKQAAPTGTRLRDVDPQSIGPSDSLVEAMTEASQVQLETGEFPYTLMAAFRQMLAESPDISDTRLVRTLEELSNRAEDRSGLIPDISFDDIGGQDKAKKAIIRAVRRNFTAPKGEIKNGILLEGPPGTGKTLLAKAAANHANAVYFHKNGANFASKWVGESQANVNEFFEEAESHLDEGRRALIFLDEADALLRKRGEANDGNAGDSAVNAFLERAEIFIQKGGILLAATNFADKLDDAATRPGRLGKAVKVDLPPKDDREKILDLHVGKAEVKLAPDVDLSQWAELAFANSGADLANLIHTAKDEMLDRLEAAGLPVEDGVITNADLDNAYHEIHMPELSDNNDETRQKFLMRDSAVGAGNGLYVAGKSGGVGQFICKLTVTDQGNPKADPVIEFAPGTPSRNFKDMTHDSIFHALNWVTANPEKLKAMGFDAEQYRGKRIQITMQSDRGHEMDGDSAGAVMTSSIVSALTGRAFKNDVAMTGTIIVDDRVKAIGGLKYKLHGASNEVELTHAVDNASQQGMRVVLFPAENMRDEWRKVPPRMRDKLHIVSVDELKANPDMPVPEGKAMIVAAVDNINDVIEVALEPKREQPAEEQQVSRWQRRPRLLGGQGRFSASA